MRLQCLVCKHQFEPSERFVKLTAEQKYENGTREGIRLAVCAKHLSREITDALLLYTSDWTNYTFQVDAEKRVFGD